MKAHIAAEKATIDGQLYEAPGIEDGECEVELVWQHQYYKKSAQIEWAFCSEDVANQIATDTWSGLDVRQILVKQEGEEKVEIKIGDIWIDTIHVKLKIIKADESVFPTRYWCEKIGRGSYCWRTKKDLSYQPLEFQSTQQSKRIAELEGALNIMICGYYDGLSEEDLLACEKALKGEGE